LGVRPRGVYCLQTVDNKCYLNNIPFRKINKSNYRSFLPRLQKFAYVHVFC